MLEYLFDRMRKEKVDSAEGGIQGACMMEARGTVANGREQDPSRGLFTGQEEKGGSRSASWQGFW